MRNILPLVALTVAGLAFASPVLADNEGAYATETSGSASVSTEADATTAAPSLMDKISGLFSKKETAPAPEAQANAEADAAAAATAEAEAAEAASQAAPAAGSADASADINAEAGAETPAASATMGIDAEVDAGEGNQ